MRNSLWLACILIGFLGSCEATAPNLENLRCPTPPATTPDVPASGADPGLFGSLSKDSAFNCIKNPSICASLGTNFSCNTTQGCCDEKFMGRCNKSSDCIYNDKPVCDLTNNICVSCSSTNMALGDQQCSAWSAAQVDPLNRSLCISGLCAECRTGNDCKRTGKTFCDQVDGICKGCSKHSECLPGSGICKLDASLLATKDTLSNIGECVNTTDVVYVDRGYVNCSSGDGTQGKPFCELNNAVATGKSYIVLRGNGSAAVNMYQAVTVDSGRQVAIMGPGSGVPAAQQAVITGVTATGGGRVTLSGVSVTNSVGQPSVQCGASASLYVQSVQITNAASPGGGIYANACTKVVIEKTKIAGALGYGIFITGGSGHRVINNAIINGGVIGEPAGMRLSGSASGLFAYNTIASNRQGGVVCDSPVAVTDSIVMANGADPQVSTTCQAARIVTTGVTLDPSYMNATSPGDPKLIADPSNLCIDKGMPDANQTIKDDYYGTARPQGNGYDIGFQEVR